jgi:hypothetical protein
MDKRYFKALILVFALMFLFWWCGGCKPKVKDLPGSYVEEGSFGGSVFHLNKDGTFTKFNAANEVAHGRWHITDGEYLFDSGVELDTESSAHTDSSADNYLLARRGGKLCWEVREVIEYWCKIDP